MKVVLISDTHGQHEKLDLPQGDMIIHAGDVSSTGKESEIEDFLDWFDGLEFEHKIFVAGNHDFYFERALESKIQTLIPEGVTYLNDSGIRFGSLNIWGSPIQPWFYDWAFNRERGPDIAKHWKLIPSDTNVLITHGPPFEILDTTIHGTNVGCEDLVSRIDQLNLKLHVFGHIHEAYGMVEKNGTKYVNASVLNVSYQCVNPPWVLNL